MADPPCHEAPRRPAALTIALGLAGHRLARRSVLLAVAGLMLATGVGFASITILGGLSQLVSPIPAARIGLVPTMVYTHLCPRTCSSSPRKPGNGGGKRRSRIPEHARSMGAHELPTLGRTHVAIGGVTKGSGARGKSFTWFPSLQCRYRAFLELTHPRGVKRHRGAMQ